MSSTPSGPRREVKIAAIIALIGGSAFALAGLTVAGVVAFTVVALSRQYHVSIRGAGPDFREVMEIFAFLAGAPLALGIAGILTGRGLLRLKAWARLSALTWAIASTLMCLYLLVHPTFKSGLHASPAAVDLLMLVLFPINAWWLFLLLRPSTKELFGDGIQSQRAELADWLRKDRTARYAIVIVGTFVVVGGAAWKYQQNSAMKEIAGCRDALSKVTSWHYHKSRYVGGTAPEITDGDMVCPSFQHQATTYQDAAGVLQTREGIYYFGTSYVFYNGRWQASQRQAGFVDPGIPECNYGPIGADQSSLPLGGVVEDGYARRGELIRLDGDECREYAISVPTPHDPTEKEFKFTICIDERDHLPRETRRTLPGASQETVSRFGKWNVMKEAELPADFPK